jgi:hypothetical protein
LKIIVQFCVVVVVGQIAGNVSNKCNHSPHTFIMNGYVSVCGSLNTQFLQKNGKRKITEEFFWQFFWHAFLLKHSFILFFLHPKNTSHKIMIISICFLLPPEAVVKHANSVEKKSNFTISQQFQQQKVALF